MKKIFLIAVLFFPVQLNAQLMGAKIVGKNGSDFTYGYGGFLKFSYPLSIASDVSLEIGALSFSLKKDHKYGWDIVPLKAGFRYVLTGKEAGPYIEPQLGYNIYGITSTDKEFTGFVWGVGTGYLFEAVGRIRFDLGLRFESALYKGGALNYLMLRLTHNFSIRRRY